MEPKKNDLKLEPEAKQNEESKQIRQIDSSKTELDRLRDIEKAQIEKITKLRGQIANQEVAIERLRKENEKIKDKIKSVVVSTREAELEMALKISQMNSISNRGLSEAEIDVMAKQNLPIFTLDYLMTCPICKNEIPLEHLVKSLPICGHIFHIQCIDNWLISNKVCPECLTPALD